MNKVLDAFQKPIVAFGATAISLIMACVMCAILFFYSLGSASSIEMAVAATVAAQPNNTPIKESIPETVVVEITKIVTVTFTATPLYTPTITNTPAPTSTPLPPTSTPNVSLTSTASALAKLLSNKTDGIYLVNIDIAPGVWRSDGTSDNCYWKRSTRTGDIIDNYFGRAGGTVYIAPSDFQVQFEDCGTWTFLSPP